MSRSSQSGTLFRSLDGVGRQGPILATLGWKDITDLVLAVEVISPSTARWDRFDKRTAYQQKNVPEYWVVDLDARAFECWRPGDDRPELLNERLAWHPVPTAPPFTIDLANYFADVWA